MQVGALKNSHAPTIYYITFIYHIAAISLLFLHLFCYICL